MTHIDELKPLFLAHSSEDKAFVRRLAVDVSIRGVPVWFDEWEIKVGASIADRIAAGIQEAGWLGVVLSAASAQSAWVRLELNAGLVRELELRAVFVLPIGRTVHKSLSCLEINGTRIFDEITTRGSKNCYERSP